MVKGKYGQGLPERPVTRRDRSEKRGLSVFCLGVCLTLLLIAALPPLTLDGRAGAAGTTSGLSKAPPALSPGEPQPPAAEAAPAQPASIDPCWLPLLERLKADGMHGTDVQHWFASMPDSYSQEPMGVKVSLLFKNKFVPPYFPYFRKPVQPAYVYSGVVTRDNIRKCYDFLQNNGKIFQRAEEQYFVPKEVLVSLLMVETRLGSFMGREKAFWSLACMASATQAASINTYLERLPVTAEHEAWLADLLEDRSDWAYAELKSLILYCRLHEHDPLQIEGSIYGAIGICQFMPSNIPFYAVDGNDDGKIDLFALEDAASSAANFLKEHGWRDNIAKDIQIKLLKRYNHSTAYANTILGLSNGVVALARNKAQKQAGTNKS